MKSLSNAYVNAEHFSTKRQILAIVAPDFSISTIKENFPDVTDYLIKQARNHAYQNGRCHTLSWQGSLRKTQIKSEL